MCWKAAGKVNKQFFPTEALAREFKGTIGSGKGPRRPQSSKTIRDYWKTWLPSYRGRTTRGLTDSTRREYRRSFEQHIDPLAISRIKMRDLTPADVREWCEQLERRGVSPRSIKHAKIALGLMFACAAEDSAVAGNPVRLATYIPSREALKQHARPQPLTLTAEHVLSVLDAMPEDWRAFFFLLAHSGMRIGELLGLTWEHVHLGDDPHVRIVEQMYRGERKEPKWGSVGRVELSPGMAAWLTDLRPPDLGSDGRRVDADGRRVAVPVFQSKTGSELSYRNVYNRVLRPALVKAGIALKVGEKQIRGRSGKQETVPIYDYRGVGFHAFRHSFGSLLHDRGVPLAEIQRLLRHKQLTTTMNVYVKPLDERRGGAEVLDTILPVGAYRGANVGQDAAANDRAAEPVETAA